MSTRPMIELVPGRLWHSGSIVPLREVVDAKINVILNVGDDELIWMERWEEEVDSRLSKENNRRAIYARIVLLDADDTIDVVATDAAIDFGLGLLRSDPERRVLVHCDAGAYRSVHVAAGILSAIENLPGREAFRQVDLRHGFEDPRSSLDLRGWAEHVGTFYRRIPVPTKEEGGTK